MVKILTMDRKTILLIISALRRASITWHVRNQALTEGRRKKILGKFLNGKDKWVWENFCEICGDWFELKDNAFEVDHIIEVGPFPESEDWNYFMPRIFCDRENLQRLCHLCHLRKTSNFNSVLRYKRKNKEEITYEEVSPFPDSEELLEDPDEAWRDL